ncbi:MULTISPECIES: NrfD/PsrC family molybdoenzyme membrane anchor subunit [Achromobacter]|uniref:Tetrathionate reductase n=1 Tax=Achromobacter spanius TaxID=217203 RepID=A0AAW3I1T8_9BURK|nr:MULTISPECIES: NrfD/PsrC family molybdoenzyme membrane anchor subunit [Achromobacter]KNE26651.1 tetrathionate reductase [Achromobacter spanius]MCD0497087.1 polysulfide reductase NrfD [Achromobacter sp. MY14]MCW3155442.1 polysulfide reductase NrfD [Achromobacter spanius]
MQISELLTPVYDAAWLPWAVQYFFLIGIAATTALTAVFAAFGEAGSPLRRLLPAAATVLLVSAVAAPVSLLADLHQPGRFWHFYAHITPWSWMWLGALLLPVFVGLSVLFCAAWWWGRIVWLRVLGVALALSAASILVYTGAEVMVLRSRPLWHTAFLPVNFALTAWLGALGAMFLVGRWLPGGMKALPVACLRGLSVTAVILMAVGAGAWAALGLVGADPSFDAALRLFAEFPIWRLSLAGAVITGFCMIALLQRPAPTLAAPLPSAVLALTMLGAAWIFRWVVFMSVQGVPKYGAGLYLYDMPWGSDGLLGMVGVLGLCVALITAVTWALEAYPARARGMAA